MTKDVAQQRIAEAIAMIDSLKPDDLLFEAVDQAQISRFRGILIKMSEDIVGGKLPERPYRQRPFSRPIIDSWPLNHPLGEALIRVERAVLEL